jgi:hypothetical protein
MKNAKSGLDGGGMRYSALGSGYPVLRGVCFVPPVSIPQRSLSAIPVLFLSENANPCPDSACASVSRTLMVHAAGRFVARWTRHVARTYSQTMTSKVNAAELKAICPSACSGQIIQKKGEWRNEG